MNNPKKLWMVIAVVAFIAIGLVGCGETTEGDPLDLPEGYISSKYCGTYESGGYTLYLYSNSARVIGTGSKGTASGTTETMTELKSGGFYYFGTYNSIRINTVNLWVQGFGLNYGGHTFWLSSDKK